MARSLKVSPQYKQKVESAFQRSGLPTQKDLAHEAGVSLSTVKSFLSGKGIDRLNFQEICRVLALDWKEIIHNNTQSEAIVKEYRNNSPIPCTAYKEETWVGREEDIRELSQKLRKECRILIITGITGQGKTALAERLANVELGGEWQRLPAVNFDDGVSRDFVGAADVLLTRLGETVTPQERSQPEILLNRLVQKLRSNCYLVQIDSLEVLLKKGDENPVRNEFEDERWWEFFQQLLAGGQCQSRLILTSQHLPTQFSKEYDKFWHKKSLSGLSETEQLQLFSKLFEEEEKEILPDSEAAGYLLRMGNIYQGHPLLIEVLAGEILEHPYNGNVVAYWRKHQQEFEAIAPARNSEELERNVKDRVRETLKRLEKDAPYAYELLLRSSVYRLPVTEDFWLAMLQGLTDEEKDSALGTLKYRYLVEIDRVTDDGKEILRQHNLIRNVAYQQRLLEISKQGLDWKSDHYIAAQMWRTAYQPEPDASNLEQVRGYLEAFHHYCEVEDWESASTILFISLNICNNAVLHKQLHIWGYYHQQIDLYTTLLGKLSPDLDAIFLKGLGNAYCVLAEYHQAIEFYQQSLAIARKTGERQLEGTVLGNLGNVYIFQGDYHQAIDYYQQDLVIAREIGNRWGEGAALGNLGNAYFSLGNYTQAIEYHQHNLLITRSLDDKSGEGRVLGNIGNTYSSLGNYDQAINYYQQHLATAREFEDRLGEATALGNLGSAYYYLKDYHQAIDYYQQQLTIAQAIGDRAGVGRAMGGLGIIYKSMEDYTQAIDYYQQWLAIAQKIGDRTGEGNALCNLGDTLIKVEQYSVAQEYLQISLKIFIKIANRHGEAHALCTLGEVYHKLGQPDRALEYCEQALALATKLGIPLAKECQKLKEQLLKEE